MATLYIRDVPYPLYERLREQARRHHRSVTKEALVILEEWFAVTDAAEPAPSVNAGERERP